MHSVRTHISGETAKKRLNIPVSAVEEKDIFRHDELKLRKKSEASSEESRQVHFIVFFSELKEEIYSLGFPHDSLVGQARNGRSTRGAIKRTFLRRFPLELQLSLNALENNI
ncbi:hypothetical protein ACJX0J_005122 (mitochondrion) [Zea mays]